MKLSRTPVTLALDRPRRVVFNMHVRKQMEELQDAGTLDVGRIFTEKDGQRVMNWSHAMIFVTVALREDAEANGEMLEVADIERQIESIPEALEIVGQVFGAYSKFLGIDASGEGKPPAASEGASRADAGARSGRAKRPIAASAENTDSAPASSGD